MRNDRWHDTELKSAISGWLTSLLKVVCNTNVRSTAHSDTTGASTVPLLSRLSTQLGVCTISVPVQYSVQVPKVSIYTDDSFRCRYCTVVVYAAGICYSVQQLSILVHFQLISIHSQHINVLKKTGNMLTAVL